MHDSNVANRFYELATKGEWSKVINFYRRTPALYGSPITNSGETPFHVALTLNAPEVVVENMLNIVVARGGSHAEAVECLKMADKEGNTTLHLAASKGYTRVCGLIAGADRSLICKRNQKDETPLHMALSGNSPEYVVENMLDIIVAKGRVTKEAREYLKMADKEGNTALHLAASKGYARVCERIVNMELSLITQRNKNDQTPVFVAALHGKMYASFDSFVDTWERDERRSLYQTNGAYNEKILQIAVSKEHIDLVIKISDLFPEFVAKLTSVHMDIIRRNLFKLAMKGDWERVVKIYGGIPATHSIRITKSGDTALHIAVSNGRKRVALDLMRLISANRTKSALKVQNERGNTPLHLAAALGNVEICKSIVNEDSSLVSDRNNDNETPFFLAALHGKNDAFILLHDKSQKDGHIQGSSYWRGKEGATILHAAIAGDYFDLAFRIIHLYGDLVNFVDEKGTSPLHLLATKPSAFRSGSNLAGCHKLIYNCTFVEELKAENVGKDKKPPPEQSLDIRAVKCLGDCPDNYKTCAGIVLLVLKAGKILSTRSWKDTNDHKRDAEKQEGGGHRHKVIPPNYNCCFDLVKLFSKALLVIFGLGSSDIEKIREKRKKHTWAAQVMNELLHRTKMYEYEFSGGSPPPPSIDDSTKTQPYKIEDGGDVAFFQESLVQTITKPSDQTKTTRETPILIAAKNGIKEMVEKILDLFPVAIQDQDANKKNIVLLAVENRQPHVYEFLVSTSREGTTMQESTFLQVDGEGNSALHLAAKLGAYKPWRIPGAALQMQWEFKWYEYVKDSMPPHFFMYQNTAGKTAKDLFTESHSDLVKSGGEWLTNTSESCSVVAALIATVAFATAATVPGGVNQESGRPVLEKQPAFNVFSIASLIALCFSVTAVVMFLSILTSRHQEKDFGRDLPRKLLLGLTTLFISIAAILVSFCAGHFFVLNDELRFAAYPVYMVTCLPVSIFALAQFPLYFDLVRAFLITVPQRSYMVVGT